ncbi:MAG: lipoyl(octanoyl) transferase LipB [Cyanobacteria bacterium SBLK]|nr:lipoyl(octanoyl) transferase LipB [Cyanobacteria bacterium SBLK]
MSDGQCLQFKKNARYQRQCCVKYWGLVPYKIAWEEQRSLVTERLSDPKLNDILLLLEHPPVYTLGTGSREEFLKFNPQDSEWELYRTERGGEVTYHCPGQLIGYPILNLRYYHQDLHWYLRQLEEVIIRVVAKYGLIGERISGLTGVWVQGYKVAAIAIKVKRWITMHGFALNVCPDLSGFSRIIPCGIEDKPVGSLAQFIPDIQIEKVREEIMTQFSEVFSIECVIH